MGLKRKDFQKAAVFLKEFLLKLNEDIECAELRDTLTLALLHMQKYYRLLQCRTQERTSQHQLSLSARGLSPMTPFVDAPDKFQWKWANLDSAKYLNSSTHQDEGFFQLPDIILAIQEENFEWISKIIQQDLTLLDETDGLGRTGLFYAIHNNNLNVLQYLLDNGADPNFVAHDGTSPIHKACHDGNYRALELLIVHGGDIHAQDTQLRAPIHWAVTTPGLECLQSLIRNKADMNARDKDGLTPCMWACRVDHFKHFEMLYKSNKDLLNRKESETDDSGRSCLHWAVRRTEPLKCLQLLLSRDSAALKDEEGKTVILVAAEQGSFPACKLIFEMAGPNVVNDRDNMDRTSLHLATIRGHGTVLNFLLENGADLELRDRFGATAWDYAKNKQLHYCQLIMMSHKRQSLQSSPRDSRSNGEAIGSNGNFEPWMKMQENTPDSAPGRILYNLDLTDRSNNGDVSSRNGNGRRSSNAVMNNKNNNNCNIEDYHSINNISNNNNNIPGSKQSIVKVRRQPHQVFGTGNPVNGKMYHKENEVIPVKDMISSPCPPKKPRTGPCLARASFQHRSLSESFERHLSQTQSVDYAEMDPVEISRSEGTESRLGVYERSNTLDNPHITNEQELENCEDQHMHPDSNEEEDIEVVSGEMDVSNIDEDDRPPSPNEIAENFEYENLRPHSGFPYPPRCSYPSPTPSAPLLAEVTPPPEFPNQGESEMNNSSQIGVGFPCPRPPPASNSNSNKGNQPSGILLNRRPLLSRNQPKIQQPLPKQPLKPRNSSAKMSVPRPTGNPKNYRSETPPKGKGPKPGSFGSDTSEEHNENGGPLSWHGLAPVTMNTPSNFTAPVNPVMSPQEPLPKFLHRGNMPPAGSNPGTGANINHNAWPPDRHGSSDLTSGNLKLAEMSDLGFPAADAGPGLKDSTEPQEGIMHQHHLSPSSSTSSLSLAHNKSASANTFHMSAKPTGQGLGGQKSDIRRLPSALIPLTNAPPLPQGQPIVRKKKKKRKKQENQGLLFENTVVEGKSLQNSTLSPNQLMGVRPLAPTGLSTLSTESKDQRIEPTLPPPSMMNNQKTPDPRTKDSSIVNSRTHPAVTSHNKGRGRSGGLWMAPSTRQDPQNSELQTDLDDGQRAVGKDEGFNELTTVGTGLFGKKPTHLNKKPNNIPPSSVNNSEELNRDLRHAKPLQAPMAKDKWSLPENGLPSASKKQLKPASPFSLVEPEPVKTKPPLPYTRKSLPR